MKVLFVIAVFSYIALANGLFNQCSGGKQIENIEEKVSITPGCKKTYCRLRKKSSVDVLIKFTPDKEVKKLTNTVTAQIAGIPFPFIGVDGENACPNVFEVDGTTPAKCPLKAGTEYLYKNQINVLEIYPRLKVIVHWGLTTPDGNDLACFEVAARITN